jgi:hypothetical protein
MKNPITIFRLWITLSDASLFRGLCPAVSLVSFHPLNSDGALCSHDQASFFPANEELPLNPADLRRIPEN